MVKIPSLELCTPGLLLYLSHVPAFLLSLLEIGSSPALALTIGLRDQGRLGCSMLKSHGDQVLRGSGEVRSASTPYTACASLSEDL